MTGVDPSTFVDLQRYPLTDSGGEGARLATRCREDLNRRGACVLEGFIRPDALRRFVDECASLESQSHHNALTGNAYLGETDDSLPADHPVNMTDTTALGVVAYDQIPPNHGLRRLYEWPVLLDFLARAAGKKELYYYECPLGAMNIAVMKQGDYLRWHFDQSDFVVSIPVRDPGGGGLFEYARHIRSADDEHYEDVAAVLRGDRSRVEVLDCPPGSLVLFEGRYTLHRVTPIQGSRTRLTALLGYADRPGVVSSEHLRMIRYGRVS